MTTDTELLDRFHAVLVDEIRANRPDLLTSPFTVAEIYQELVPYRTHRDRIGVEMNGDYEHALIRLLAGEGDYLVLEADAAREELRAELHSANPNTGLFREYAAADVRLNPHRLSGGEEETGSRADDAPVAVEELAPVASPRESGPEPGLFDGGGERAEPTAPQEPAPAPAPSSPESGEEVAHREVEAGEVTDREATDREATDREAAARKPEPGRGPEEEDVPTCPWCRGPLPNRENLNYCPFCGTDVNVVPCPSCGEALEPDWRFCIACGAGVASD